MNKVFFGLLLAAILLAGTYSSMNPVPMVYAHDSGWHDYCYEQTLGAFINIITELLDLIDKLPSFLAKALKSYLGWIIVLATIGGMLLSWSCSPTIVPPQSITTENFKGFQCETVGGLRVVDFNNEKGGGSSIFTTSVTPTVTVTSADGTTEKVELPKIYDEFLLLPLALFELDIMIGFFLDSVTLIKKVPFLNDVVSLLFGLLFGFLDWHFFTSLTTEREDGNAYSGHPMLQQRDFGARDLIGKTFELGKNEITYFVEAAVTGSDDEAPVRFNVYDLQPPRIIVSELTKTLEANTRWGYNVDRSNAAETFGVRTTDNCAETVFLNYDGEDFYELSLLKEFQSAKWIAIDQGYEIWEPTEEEVEQALLEFITQVETGSITLDGVHVHESGPELARMFNNITDADEDSDEGLTAAGLSFAEFAVNQCFDVQTRVVGDCIDNAKKVKAAVWTKIKEATPLAEKTRLDKTVRVEMEVGMKQAKDLRALGDVLDEQAPTQRFPSTKFANLEDFDALSRKYKDNKLGSIFASFANVINENEEKFGRAKLFPNAPTVIEREDGTFAIVEKPKDGLPKIQAELKAEKIEVTVNDADVKFKKGFDVKVADVDGLGTKKSLQKLAKKLDTAVLKDVDRSNFAKAKNFDLGKLETKDISFGKIKINEGIGKALGRTVLGAGIAAGFTAIGEAIGGSDEPNIVSVDAWETWRFQNVKIVDTVPPDILVTGNVAEEVDFIVGQDDPDQEFTITVDPPLIFDIADPFPTLHSNVTGTFGIIEEENEFNFKIGLHKVLWFAEDFSGNISENVTQFINVKPNGTNIISVALNQTIPDAFASDPKLVTVEATNPDRDPIDFFIITNPSEGVILSPFIPVFQDKFQINGTVSRLRGISHAGMNDTFVADAINQRIMLLTGMGDLNIAFDVADISSKPEGIAVNGTIPNQTFFISDWPNNKIFEVKDAGEKGEKIKEIDISGLFKDPKNIAINQDDIYVTDFQGASVTKLNDFEIFESPEGIVRDNLGNIIVADSGTNQVSKFNSSGIFLSRIGAMENFDSPTGVAINGGDVLVSDTGNNKIKMFDSNGVLLDEFGDDSQFDMPRSVAAKGTEIFVADTNNHRIQKFAESSPILINEEYTNDSGWTTVSIPNVGEITINGIVKFTNITSGPNSDWHGIYKQIDTLDNDGWKATFDLRLEDEMENTPTTSTGYIWLLTNDIKHPSDSNDIDSLAVYLDESELRIFQGHNSISSISSTSISINDNTNYSIIFERTNSTFAALNVLDSGTMLPIDTPIHLIIDEDISNLDVLQHTNDFVNGGGNLTLQIDNTKIQPKFAWVGACTDGINCDIANSKSFGFSCTDATCTGLTSGNNDGQFSNPQGIAHNGTHVLISDTGNDRIQIFDQDGIHKVSFGSTGTNDSEFNSPIGISFFDDEILVADTGNNRIQIFDSSTNHLDTIGTTTPSSDEGFFDSPSGVTTDGTAIYVSDTNNARIQKLDLTGQPLSIWNSSINTRFEGFATTLHLSPEGIKVDSISANENTKSVFLADWEPANETIFKLKRGGGSITSMNVSSYVDNPENIAVDSSDIVYATDSGQSSLNLFNLTSGTRISQIDLSNIDLLSATDDVISQISLIPNGIEISSKVLGFNQDQVFIYDDSSDKIFALVDHPNIPNSFAVKNVFNASRIFTNLQDIALNENKIFGLHGSGSFKSFVILDWQKGIVKNGNLGEQGENIKGITFGESGENKDLIFFLNASDSSLYHWNPSTDDIQQEFEITNIDDVDAVGANPATKGFLNVTANSEKELFSPTDLEFGGPDNNLYVSSYFDNSVKIYNSTTFDLIGSLEHIQLKGPKGITFDANGTLYVSAIRSNSILKFNTTTNEFEDIVATRDQSLTRPVGITFGKDGLLYIANSGNDNIIAMNLTNNDFKFFVNATSVVRPDSPQYLRFDSNDNLFVTSFRTNEVLVYDSNGMSLGVFGEANQTSSNLLGPKDLTFSPDGKELLVSSWKDNKVLRYNTTDGKFLGAFVEIEPVRPEGIAFDDTGNFYVSSYRTSEVLQYGNITTRFYVADWSDKIILGFNEQGDKTTQILLDNSLNLNQPMNLAVDSVGTIWITDFAGKLVNIDGRGEKLSSIDLTNFEVEEDEPSEVTLSNGTMVLVDSKGNVVSGSTPITFSMKPDGIAIDEFDNIFVSDWENDRVVVFDIQGTPLDVLKFNGTFFNPSDLAIKRSQVEPYEIFVLEKEFDGTANSSILGFDFNKLLTEMIIGGKSSSQTTGLEWVDTQSNFLFEINNNVFNSPTFIDGTSKILFISDSGNQKVKAFDTAGNFLFEVSGFNNPSGVTITKQGSLLVADQGFDVLNRFSLLGNPLSVIGDDFGEPQFSDPAGVATNSTDHIFVVEQGMNRVQILNLDEESVGSFGAGGNLEGFFNSPTGIAIDEINDFIYVADTGNHRIQVFEPSGEFFFEWGTQGTDPGQFDFPTDITIDSGNDRVFVTDSNNHRVQVFSGKGDFIFEWGSDGTGEDEFDTPFGITVDSTSGKVFVSDVVNNRIQVFEPIFSSLLFGLDSNSLVFESDLDTRIETLTDLYIWPEGISVTDPDSIFVTDWKDVRIIELNSTGHKKNEFSLEHVVFPDITKLRDITINEQQNFFFIADSRKATIPKILQNGLVIDEQQLSDKFIIMSGIAVGSDETFYVLSTEEGRINKYTERGILIANTKDGIAEGTELIDITTSINPITNSDILFVAMKDDSTNKIVKYNSALQKQGEFSVNRTPTGVAVDTLGNIYVSQLHDNPIPIVEKFMPDFSFDTQVPFSEGGRLSDVIIDQKDSLYGTDADNHRIHKVNLTSNQYIGWLGKCLDGDNCNKEDQSSRGFTCTSGTCSNVGTTSSGPQPAQFFEPKQMSVDDFGFLYVSDTQNIDNKVFEPRIQKFSDNGFFIDQTISDTSATNLKGNFADIRGTAISKNNFYVIDIDKLHVFDVNPFSPVKLDELTNITSSNVTYLSPFESVGKNDTFQFIVDDGFNQSKAAHVNITLGNPDFDDDGIFNTVDFNFVTNTNTSQIMSTFFKDDLTSTAGQITDSGNQKLLIRNDRDLSKGLFIESSVFSGTQKATISACDDSIEFKMDQGDRIVLTCDSPTQLEVIRGTIPTVFFDGVGRSLSGMVSSFNTITFNPDGVFLTASGNVDENNFVVEFNGLTKTYTVPKSGFIKVDTAPPLLPNVCSEPIVLEADSLVGVDSQDAPAEKISTINDFLQVIATDVDNGFPKMTDRDEIQTSNDAPIIYLYNLTMAQIPTETTVSFTAIDSIGNNSTCLSTVGVEDTTSPVLELFTSSLLITTPDEIVGGDIDFRFNTAEHSETRAIHYALPKIFDLPAQFQMAKERVLERQPECFPPSGFEFPIGVGTVVCSGFDRTSRNEGTESFSFEIKSIPNGLHINEVIASGTNSIDPEDGEEIIIRFNQPTNKPAVFTKADIDNLLTLTDGSLGANYTGKFLTPKDLIITLIDSSGANLVPGITKFAINGGSGITSASGLQRPSFSSVILSGSFDKIASPFIIGFVAEDNKTFDISKATNIDEARDDFIFSAGDTIIVLFSTSTNTPFGLGILDKETVDKIFTFIPETPQISASRDWEYEGQWGNPFKFKITILQVNSDPDDDPLIGIERIQVNNGANLTDKDGITPPSTSLSDPLSGSFAPFSSLRKVLANGSAVFTLPQGIFLEVKSPVEDSIGVQTTDDTTPGFKFLGNTLEITSFEEGTCDLGCDISFTFNGAELAQNDITLGELRIFHDANNNGKFKNTAGVAEILLPTIVPPQAPGPFTATVKIFSLSSVSIGSIIPSGGGGGGGDETPPDYLNFEYISCDPVVGCGAHFLPEIKFITDMPTAIIPTGHTAKLILRLYENSGPTALEHVSLYTNIRGFAKGIQDSDTFVRFNKGDPITVKDSSQLLSEANILVMPRGKNIDVIFSLKFDKPMEKSDIIIRVWDYNRNSKDVRFVNAIQVVDMQSQGGIIEESISQTATSQLIPQEIFSKWAGFSEESVSDSELLSHFGIEGNNIPSWYKTQVSKWLKEERITQMEFVDAMRFFEYRGLLT